MTASYKWVQWNRHKKVYDLVIAAAAVAYIITFILVGTLASPAPNQVGIEIMLIRALGTLAIIILHIILCIGPLARLTPLAAPLLYNRRHLGVTFFFIALAHAALAALYYGGFGVRDPLSATIGAPLSFASVSAVPFEIFGFLALVIFFILASTSHDFWLANLSPRVWKSLHMLIYFAYALVLLHVAFGALQSEPGFLYPALIAIGAITVTALHLTAAFKEVRRDAAGLNSAPGTEWLDVAAVHELELNGATTVCIKGGERVALVRTSAGISAVSNLCAHQGGPLGEGRVIDGCLTCPWHGYQYDPAAGQSPPPYTETLPTYDVRVEGERILINPTPNPPGTPVPPAPLANDQTQAE